ncbi:deoxyribonuclease-1 [Tupaia chinensis]|uniref:Deoxyribonuclease n=1 Tax=Tupaia chinensis TaxID=246437 RepID=L9LBR9_TUPCH|nr:deoxyribonuclease-1 [Tupaia chinensis]ELW72124.1 Deoxyribonuclease-1 [Tupaia chinensis]
MGTRRLMEALLALAGLLQVALSLKIAAFNIRAFGESKMNNVTLSNYITQIVSDYDIALIQEVRDSHLVAVGKLLDKLNRDVPDSYHYVVSRPLGPSTYKERYLFLHRRDQVSVLDSYDYTREHCKDHPCSNHTFSRPPIVVKFSSPCTHVKTFTIVPLHAAPEAAAAEIDALYDVYQDVREKWATEDIMLMGDFNAGCRYVTEAQWPGIRLRTDPALQWLIDDTADTTVTSTYCPYDRIVVSGTLLQEAVVPDSATTFDFEAAYKLSKSMALAISDHYPVEVTLKRTQCTQNPVTLGPAPGHG